MKPAGKYGMRDLHQEIDLLDRKMAYSRDHEQFACDSDRAAALRKLTTRRLSLIKTVNEATARGLECEPKYMARSIAGVATSEKAGS
jgi:hypothetical protein